jgi:hypothetical protein
VPEKISSTLAIMKALDPTMSWLCDSGENLSVNVHLEHEEGTGRTT